MDSAHVVALRERIESRSAAAKRLARNSITYAIAEDELKQLEKELKTLLGDDSDPAEPDALVGAPLKPRPHLRSGAIALVEPDDPYEMA
jgi:hypothetical protein